MTQASVINKEDILKLSFEEALAELEEIVKKLELGNKSLEEAVDNYQRGRELQQYCEQKLKSARLRINKINQLDEQNIELVPVEFD